MFQLQAVKKALAIGLLLAGCSLASANDQPEQSRWGPIPAKTDSVTTEAPGVESSLWEDALYGPYRLIGLPVAVFYIGTETVSKAAYENGVYRTLKTIFGPFDGPWGTRVGKNITAGGLKGYGGGLTVTHQNFLNRGGKFKLGWQYTTNDFNKVTLGIRLHEAGSSLFDLGFGYKNQPNSRYFGTGPYTPEEDESFYTQEMTWFGSTFRRDLGTDLFVEASGLYSMVGTRGPGDPDEDIPLTDVFAVAPLGYGERSDGFTFGLSLGHDSTDQTGRPGRGGVRRVQAAYFLDNDDSDTKFWEFRGEMQQFITVFRDRRTLALRAHMSWLENRGDNEIPFQRLLVNDEPDLLRGYQDFRWRDNGMTALSAEYRWPVWARPYPDAFGLDSYVFTDVGQVFNDLDQISSGNLTNSYGWGLRFQIPGGRFVGRLEIARSDEETVIRLRGDQLFQFMKGGLYHGRNPIPSR